MGTQIETAVSAEREPGRLPTVLSADTIKPLVANENSLADEGPSLEELTSKAVVPCALTLASDGSIVPSATPAAAENVPTAQGPSTASVVQSGAAPAGKSPLANAVGGYPPGCCDQCCDCFKCCKCGPPGEFWVRQEYVGWWAQGGQVPVLVTTSQDGSLPATTPLYRGDTYNGGFRSGTWTEGGMWFDCCHTHGIQADYFWVGQLSSPFFASSNGDPILTRPFIDANTGEPAEQLIAVPGVVVGNVGIDNHNFLQGAGALMRCNLCCCEGCCDPCGRDWCQADCSRVDFLYGFRYYNFADNLGIREQLTSIDPTSGVPIGTQIDVRDSFVTQNHFYGGELGLIYQRFYSQWMLEGGARVALGDMNSIVRINGSTVVSYPGQPTAYNEGGLLALSSNIGKYNQNNFVAIPMFSLRIGYRVTERLTFMAGYTMMFFSQLARAGDQIDTTVNPNLLPPATGGGPNRPAYQFHPSDLVLQGITLGAQYNF
ncbi:MAG: BBP7 family outer membrane beta-barrel protein [Pirellulales bacterium]|nr:BBP7 family outer membrane beta-barrel protein [Pirellulales bacterium]